MTTTPYDVVTLLRGLPSHNDACGTDAVYTYLEIDRRTPAVQPAEKTVSGLSEAFIIIRYVYVFFFVRSLWNHEALYIIHLATLFLFSCITYVS